MKFWKKSLKQHIRGKIKSSSEKSTTNSKAMPIQHHKSNDVSSEEVSELALNLQDKMLMVSGAPLKYNPDLEAEFKKKGSELIINEINIAIEKLDLKKLTKKQRIYLIDTAVKSGELTIVKHLAEKFILAGFKTDITNPSEENIEQPFRPTFWLPSIINRYKDKSAYRAIENYLCERFNIGDPVEINGKKITRKNYIEEVNRWKHDKNFALMNNVKVKRPRYRRHELMDEIEDFDTAKLKSIHRQPR